MGEIISSERFALRKCPKGKQGKQVKPYCDGEVGEDA
jgi:hypothetical protein